MKSHFHLVPLMLTLGACAPKAVLVEEGDKPAAPTTAAEPAEDPADGGELPPFGYDDGLLDPKNLANMPSEKDMRSANRESNSTIIVNPPEGDEPTSE